MLRSLVIASGAPLQDSKNSSGLWSSGHLLRLWRPQVSRPPELFRSLSASIRSACTGLALLASGGIRLSWNPGGQRSGWPSAYRYVLGYWSSSREEILWSAVALQRLASHDSEILPQQYLSHFFKNTSIVL